MRTLNVLAAIVVALAVTLPGAAEEAQLGSRIDDFTLRDYHGQLHSLSDYGESKLVVVVFMGTQCPLAKLYSPRLAQLSDEFAPRGVQFVGVFPNRQDSVTEIASHARRHGITFPLLKDLGNAVADKFAAERTPEVFALDEKREVRYHGRIDDQYGFSVGGRVGYQLPEPRRRDLVIALEELLAGGPVSEPLTDAPGCHIGRIREPDADADVTYSRDIAPILNGNCVFCHREGQIAPFPLTNYDETVGWAEMIREVVDFQRMPPWHADPNYGKFVNDARLSDEEKNLIRQWVDAGAPEGDPSDLPEPPVFAEGWMIPEPDEVIYMAKEPFQVPAEGVVDYQNIIVDPGWTEDKWVKAMEPRPGNPAVVHHIVMYVIPPPGVSKYYSANLPKTALDWFASYAPGLRPPVLPDDTARFIPAGSKLNFQMHYTPNGTAQSDLSYVGIKFADPEKVKREIAVQHAGNHSFVIPAHAENHRVESFYTFRKDSLLWSVSPHMHLRGKDFLYKLIYPSGEEKTILSVPQYDFGWQTTYVFEEPMHVPAGTKMHCIAHFDNSENNLNNPDPTINVRYGPQTWEEMMYGWFEICLADQDLTDETISGERDPRARTGNFLAALEAGGVLIDDELRGAASRAWEQDERFLLFATLVNEKVPQLDRADVVYITSDRLRPSQVAELNGIRTTFRSTSTTLSAEGAALADYLTAGNEPVVHDDLAEVDDSLLGRMAKRGVKSSVHVPFERGGQRYLASYWSTEPEAFGPAAVEFLIQVTELLAAAPESN